MIQLRPCPVPGCTRKHDRRHMMCGPHWRLVPQHLRDEVWRTFRRLGVLSEEYLAAREAAIKSVTR